MSEWVNLDVVDGVGPVALKRRRPREDAALLDHEAAVLAAVDHPGVVRLVERRGGSDPALVTHFVATHSLATAPPLGVDDALTLVATLARTVAELHMKGVRHGALDPSHVLLGPGRRPVLCGFSGATLPDTPADQPPTPADDVAGIGRVIDQLLAGHDGLEPIPVRRSLRRARWSGYRQRALLTLADHCQADDAEARPSAAALAATIADLVEPPRLRVRESTPLLDRERSIRLEAREHLRRTIERIRSIGAAGHPPSISARVGRRSGLVGLALIGLVASGVTVRSLLPAASASGERGRETPSIGDRPSTADCRPDTGAVDVDGDGCPDGDPAVDGHVVTIGTERFVLGRRGDAILVGDWDCDGLATAVLVRSTPPELWHFPTWAAPGETTEAVLVTGAVDPGSVSRDVDDRGCDVLLAGPDDAEPAPVAVVP